MADTIVGHGRQQRHLKLNKDSTAMQVLEFLKQSDSLVAFANNNNGTAVVTGGNSGIGLETVKVLAAAGMKVIMCTRNLDRGLDARQSLPQSLQDRVTVQRLDLADMSSIQKASSEIISKVETIDLLVNNAGVLDKTGEKETTAQGLELQWGVNHLGHFMLTRLILPHMNRESHIVTLASRAHASAFASGGPDWGNGNYRSPYAKSKFCNVLFAKALQERLENEGRGDIISVSLHPGIIGTSIWKSTTLFWRFIESLFIDKTIEQGTATTIYCSLYYKVVPGGYYEDCRVRPSRNDAINKDDGSLRNSLWETSERIIRENGFGLPFKLI